MTRWLLACAMVVACATCPSAKAQSADAVYSNLGTFRNQSIAPGGATQQVLNNTITRLMADDLHLVGTPPYSVNGFRFVVTNLNGVDVAARVLVRFWLPDGPGGGPGTLIASPTYNPITFTAGRVGTIKTSTTFTLPSSHVWAGIAFDNDGGTSGATAQQLDGLALGAFSPATLGTSSDQYFITTAAGSFAVDNPVGTIGNFGGAPPADFGWEILAAQDVDLSITVTHGATTVYPGGSVVYTVTASNAGPDTVFDARVADTFPASLTCTWTCAGSAGNTCAGSGIGDIDNGTVSLAPGGSVTYAATCTVSSTASGTLVNTATIFTPGTAVDRSLLNNTATDNVAVTPLSFPGAPTIGPATAGNAQATVTFTPPASNGGSPITTYTVTSSPPGFISSGPASPVTVNGLANGTAYTFTVTATNAIGTGPASAPSNSVTPVALPGAPAVGIATAGNAQATIAFAAPASNGGSPITSYTVTSSPGGLSASGTGSPITLGGLTNGAAYTFTVTATNAVGTGPPSAASNTVTPATVPGAPTIGPAIPGNSKAFVTFSAPASNGGSPITSYTVTSSPPGVIAGGAASPITVTNLVNGTAYTFTVTATNVVGVGPASAPSNSVTPLALPDAPPTVIATAGNAQATVAFSPPPSDGGFPITSYTVTSSPGGIAASGPGSPVTVGGLTNGTAYTFTVTATTSVGTGPASPASNTVTPATVPGAPTIGTATAGNAQATVTFTAPVSNGGSPITSYTVTSTPPGVIASGPASPITLSGLTNGTAYAFTVTATNAVGVGPASAPSNSVTPAALPGAPTIGSATAGNAQATVTFTPPASSGGAPIISYTVTSSPGGLTTSGAASPLTVNGLTNGTAYTFTVRAINSVGTGLPSAPSNSVIPAAVPGAPTIGAATAGNAQATVAFVAPVSNGGSPITSYTVTSSPGGISASGAASPVTVSGLTNGTAYTFTVTATNAIGMGPASSSSNSVMPAGVPGAPTIGTATAGNAQATVTFTAPASSGGSPITSYTATSTPGGISASGAASPITVSGLSNGTAYTFTVTATNAIGTGPASAPSNSVTPATPATVPGAPAIVAAIPGNGRATIAFTAPASNGGSAITSFTVTCGAFSITGAASPLTVTGLTNLTAYSCSVTATNAVGTGPASAAVSVTPDSVARSYVAPSATGSGTIAAVFTGGGLGCGFTRSAFIASSGDPASPPAGSLTGIAFPHGLFDFTLGGCTPGSTVTFTIAYPGALPAGTQYWKYGPEPGTPAPHWYVLPANITGSVVVFSITDGGQGDDDLAADGNVVDQGGPGAPPVGGGIAATVPTLSEWAMLLLSLMLVGFVPRAKRAGAFPR